MDERDDLQVLRPLDWPASRPPFAFAYERWIERRVLALGLVGVGGALACAHGALAVAAFHLAVAALWIHALSQARRAREAGRVLARPDARLLECWLTPPPYYWLVRDGGAVLRARLDARRLDCGPARVTIAAGRPLAVSGARLTASTRAEAETLVGVHAWVVGVPRRSTAGGGPFRGVEEAPVLEPLLIGDRPPIEIAGPLRVAAVVSVVDAAVLPALVAGGWIWLT